MVTIKLFGNNIMVTTFGDIKGHKMKITYKMVTTLQKKKKIGTKLLGHKNT